MTVQNATNAYNAQQSTIQTNLNEQTMTLQNQNQLRQISGKANRAMQDFATAQDILANAQKLTQRGQKKDNEVTQQYLQG